jgi:1-acyl-sn-glycerol-3-phosphate acyltransferase
MLKFICGKILKWWGWTPVNGVMPDKKAIIIGVPHTSAWDFVLSYLFYTSVGGIAHVVIKKEFFFWLLGFFLKKMGAVPVDRSKGGSLVRQIIDVMNEHEIFHLAITPEGTRKLTKNWKAGFHTIAKATGAEVYLGFFDYGKKQIGWVDKLELTDNAQDDIRRMKAYYRGRGLVGKHPELFTTDD